MGIKYGDDDNCTEVIYNGQCGKKYFQGQGNSFSNK